MAQIIETRAARINTGESNPKNLCKLAAVATSISVCLMLLDIVVSFLFKETIAFGSFDATNWFAIFRNNWFSGLRNLGILNVMEMILAIPMLFAVYVTHRNVSKTLVSFAVILSLVGTAIYISNNAAVPMFVLGKKYAAAVSDVQRSLLAAAGEAILARGEDFTPGAFIGFILSEIATLAITFVMLRGKIFKKATALIGMLGVTLLSAFTCLATFFPASQNLTMVFGMAGGTLSMVWSILVAVKLFRLGK